MFFLDESGSINYNVLILQFIFSSGALFLMSYFIFKESLLHSISSALLSPIILIVGIVLLAISVAYIRDIKKKYRNKGELKNE